LNCLGGFLKPKIEAKMFSFLPKHVDFFDDFERAAVNVVHSAKVLSELATADAGRRDQLVSEIEQAEHEGDRITAEALRRLEQAYITPIDREDIQALAERIDDIVDMIDAAGQRMMIYKVGAVRQDFVDQCSVLLRASRLMADSVSGLRHLDARKPLAALVIAVHAAEEEGDAIHHRFLAELFECGLDVFQVIKWKELYQFVEQAIDNCDDVACVVRRIELKNV
jgi:predicted phosphate transport protein (TIGR00153 family)